MCLALAVRRNTRCPETDRMVAVDGRLTEAWSVSDLLPEIKIVTRMYDVRSMCAGKREDLSAGLPRRRAMLCR